MAMRPGSTVDSSPSNDADEFVAFVRPYLTSMTRLGARLTSASEAEDVVQEALIRAWRKRSLFDPRRGSVSVWLLAITADQARRWRSRRPRWHIGDARGGVRSLDSEIDLERAVARLPRRQRLAVDCYYFVGLSIPETAAVMSCSEGTVKSTLHDARGRLKATLEDTDGRY